MTPDAEPAGLDPAESSNTLRFSFDTVEGDPELRPLIDGLDLLRDHNNSTGLDPERLLPPLSPVLLPTRAGRTVVLGACSCGETGCGSLMARVRRSGATVVWEPIDEPPDETLRRRYTFDLTQYLDAVDGAADDRPGEGRGRRAARAVRQQLGLYDAVQSSVSLFYRGQIDWISAWPWHTDVVKVSLSDADGQVVHEFVPGPAETDQAFAKRIATEVHRLRMPSG